MAVARNDSGLQFNIPPLQLLQGSQQQQINMQQQIHQQMPMNQQMRVSLCTKRKVALLKLYNYIAYQF